MALRAFLIYAALGFAVYSNTFDSSFHFDDFGSIVENLAIRSPENLSAVWKFWPTRFVTYYSLALNRWLSGLDVLSYHLFNIVVHIGTAFLLYWLVRLTFLTPRMEAGNRIAPRDADRIALVSGAVFLLHPVQTQAVTYVIQRSALLAAFFYFLSLALYARSRLLGTEGGGGAGAACLRVFSVAAAFGAFFSKEISVTLPFAVLFYESAFFGSERGMRLRHAMPYWIAVLAVPLVMALTGTVDARTMTRVGEEVAPMSPSAYLFTQFRVVVTYLKTLLFPVKQNFDYDFAVSRSFWDFSVLACFLILTSLAVWAARRLPRHRLSSFGALFFLLALLPESSVIPIKDVIFEHRLYLPMAGFSIFIVFFIRERLGPDRRRLFLSLMAVLLLLYAGLAYARNFVWKDEMTLWNDTIQKSPRKARPYSARGIALSRSGKIEEAIADYGRAIRLSPDFEEAYYNRGVAYAKQGDYERAIPDYDRAVAINPQYAQPYGNRGVAYLHKRDFKRAIEDLTRAVEIKPDYAKAYFNRSAAWCAQEEYDKSWVDFHRALSLGYDPDPAYAALLKKLSGRQS